jgi:hypothetical protein
MKMKKYGLLIALMYSAISLYGNIYIPKAKLAGETVHARVSKDTAHVTAVFEFSDLYTRDALALYFPIFSDTQVDPIQVLAGSRFELEINGKKAAIPTPCDAPPSLKTPESSVTTPRAYWFYVNIGDLLGDTIVDLNCRVVIRATYSQPLIGGVFYYLPIIPGISEAEEKKRSWSYQLFVRSGLRVMQVRTKGADYEQLEDCVVVYLKHAKIVAVQ